MRDGTPEFSQPSLCNTCQHGTVIEGDQNLQRIVSCGATYPETRVQFLVRRCSAFVERNRISYEEMERIAWILNIDKKTHEMGFINPNDRRGEGKGDR